MINWSSEFLVGNATIDEQHIKIFEIAAKAQDLLEEEFKIDKYDEILMIINELKDYTSFHFKEEEKLMFKNGYEKFIEHKKIHNSLIEEIEEIIHSNDIDDNQDDSLQSILDLVTTWILKHINNIDKLMVKEIKQLNSNLE